ncbi:MAG: tetratricopeptide repeat protein [Pseudomonadota bacterium]
MNMRVFSVAGSLWLALCGCVAVPVQPQTLPPFEDALFQPLATPVNSRQVLALSPAMRHYADTRLKPAMRNDGESALVEALYSSGQLQLEYDAETTRTAAGTFEARAGNCLSLVLMTGAFANYLGLPVHYREVLNTETWTRSGSLALANRHVNLSLPRRSTGTRVSLGESLSGELVVDFLPSAAAGRHRARVIPEATVIAMYINNRAAELLAQGRLDEAYWWAREAVVSAPRFTDSYNTLGVIYQQHGNPAAAERILRYALVLEPENTMAMSNLISSLNALGHSDEARQLAQRLAEIEPYPPFHFYDLGLAAIERGDFAEARRLLQREVSREANQPDTLFLLAIANLYLGDQRTAKRQLARAIDNSTTLRSRQLYTAKLDWLKSQGYEGRRGS